MDTKLKLSELLNEKYNDEYEADLLTLNTKYYDLIKKAIEDRRSEIRCYAPNIRLRSMYRWLDEQGLSYYNEIICHQGGIRQGVIIVRL